MPSKRLQTPVPDAWEDDDFEVVADTYVPPKPAEIAAPSPIDSLMSAAERLAQHVESNKRLWESADSLQSQSNTPYHIQLMQAPPLKQEFKPAMKMLARRPIGIDDTEDEETLRRNAIASAQRKELAAKERVEKAKKYEEVRARLFGTDINGSGVGDSKGNSRKSGTSSPASEAEGRGGRRGRGRGARGGVSNTGRGGGGLENGDKKGELFDPQSTSKSPAVLQRKTNGAHSFASTSSNTRTSTPSNGTKLDDRIVRAPRGPVGDGRGGFNNSKRGETTT